MRDAHPIKNAVECGNLARYETSAHNQNAIGCENFIKVQEIGRRATKIIGRSHALITIITKTCMHNEKAIQEKFVAITTNKQKTLMYS